MDKVLILLLILISISLIVSIKAYSKNSIPGPKGPVGPQGPVGPVGPTRSPLDPLCINNTCITQKDISRLTSMYPSSSPYYNIVNRRPIIGMSGRPSVTITRTEDTGTPANPIKVFDQLYYNVFRYNVPSPAVGSIRKWRIYAVYSDTLTGGDGPVLQFNIGSDQDWYDVQGSVAFKFPITWGLVAGENRDAFSNIVDEPTNTQHSILVSYIPDNATGNPKSVNWIYAELQALDLYQ